MSHTTTIKDIIISDVHALRSAVRHLKKNGISCDLLENAVPRAYSNRQSGMSEAAPFVLKLNDGKYDVGFYSINENNVRGYEVRTDFYTGAVERQLGVSTDEEDVSDQTKKLGKLYQAYATYATMNEAIAKGYSVDQSTDEQGNICLRLYA